jgi:hypothetical protein
LYKPPTAEKPYRTHLETTKWTSWDDIPQKWRLVIEQAFDFRL